MIPCCPICHGSASPWRAVGQLQIFRCDACQHCFHPVGNDSDHVDSVYGDDYFHGSAQGYLDYVAEEPIQRRSANHYVHLVDKQLKRQHNDACRMLDVGAACGFFCDQFQKSGWNSTGIEPNRRMRAIAAERFRLSMYGSLNELASVSSPSQFQLATVIQVISHLIDPVGDLKQIQQLLAPGGFLLIETWDRESLIARLSGRRWHEWNPPSVIHWFSRASLRTCTQDCGFEFISQGTPKKQIQIGRAMAMLRHAWSGSAIARALTSPLRLVPQRLALSYWLGDAFWMLFRKS